jgi:hypothetical protein
VVGVGESDNDINGKMNIQNSIRTIKSKSMRWAGHVSSRDDKCMQNFGQKLEEKRPHGRPRHRW